MSTTISLPTPAISVEFLSGERPAVRSVELAQHFGLQHKHVLRDIDGLRKKLPASFTEPNFGPSEYRDSTGRTLPAFLLTRDAFTLLVMGWNSQRAIEWKLKYIEAFNALERAALENARQQALEDAATARREGVAVGARAVLAVSPERLQAFRRVVRYKRMGLSTSEVAKLMDMGATTVRMWARKARTLGLEA
ncbi:hypothetical protein JCM15519_38580 [Fundidesulfovibrio butyratiphilus]